jgi:hypothetical protein
MFQSHCHILKDFFIFSFVVTLTKVNWARCTSEEVAEKTKCQNMNVNFLQPNEHESSHLIDRGQNPLKLL